MVHPHRLPFNFNTFEEINNLVGENDKIVWVLRHAERGSDTSMSGGLTSDGIQQCLTAGQKMSLGIQETSSNSEYHSTGYKRTTETAWYLGQASGNVDMQMQNVSQSTMEHYVIPITGSSNPTSEFVYRKDSGVDFNLMSRYCYDYDNLQQWEKERFNGRPEDCYNSMITTLSSTNKKKMVWTTHDFCIMPTIAMASNRQIDMRFWQNQRWCNFLSGIAIIIHQDNTRDVYPVRGLDSGIKVGY